jgi:hypothetical protein
VFILGPSPLRKRLVLHFALVILQLLESDFVSRIIMISLIFLDPVKGRVFVVLASLTWVGQEVLGSDDDIAFVRSEVLLYLDFFFDVRVGSLDRLFHNLGGHEHFIVDRLYPFGVSHTAKVCHRAFV